MDVPRVLAVDDETVSRLVLSRMLVNLGLDVVEAADVPEAIEALEADGFDLVVSDYKMPSGTGLEVAAVAKEQGIPFILLTGFSYEDDFKSDPELAPLHLTKPVSSIDLAAAVESCNINDEPEPEPAEDDAASDVSAGHTAGLAGDASLPADERSLLERNLSLFEAIGVEVTLVDITGAIVGSTAGSRGALGYEEGFWNELSIFDLTHPDDLEAAQESLADILDNPGGSSQARFRAKHADGHWENIEVYATNLLDDPDVNALVLTTRSVTIEERLRVAHSEAMRRAASQVEYVASVSHELRSPLQGILGVAQLLEDYVSGDSANLVGIIRSEAERLRRVIDDILDYAKSDQGAMELDPRPTSIHQVIGDVTDICATQVQPGVHLLTDIEPKVAPWVEVDDLRLHQILLNLVANATRFTESGRITVSCQSLPHDRLLFLVSDTGTGIAPEKLHGLFEPFRQGAPSPDNGGTGLGLTISKNLIGLMGGRLDVESELGEGSTFSFAINAPEVDGADSGSSDDPAATESVAPTGTPGPEAPSAPSTSSAPTAPAAPRAIVVDDGQVNRMVISRQLELMGFEVDTADGGELGTEMILANDYHVVVTDWHMPEVDGLDLIARVRAAQADGPIRTPIITMTASAMAADRERCLNAGADGFLAKPATKDELFEVVGQYLEREHSADSGDHDHAASPHTSPNGSNGAAPAAEPDAVDVRVVEDLGEQLGNPGAVANVVRSFLGELERLGAAITNAINAGDADAAADAAHTLKAPSFMLGAMPLGELCRGIEDRTIDIAIYDTAAFESKISETSAALTSWLEAAEVTT